MTDEANCEPRRPGELVGSRFADRSVNQTLRATDWDVCRNDARRDVGMAHTSPSRDFPI